ncbi:MAG: hypothetical protein ACUZ77_07580, partial [Candidatus Brocadiales bacterium]
MINHDGYLDALSAISPSLRDTATEQETHLIAVELTKLLLNQHLKLSLFTFYTPTSEDAYLRPLVHYDVNDY